MRKLIEALLAGRITDLDAALAEAGARHAKIDRDRLRQIIDLVTQVLGDDPEAKAAAQAELDAIPDEPIAEAEGVPDDTEPLDLTDATDAELAELAGLAEASGPPMIFGHPNPAAGPGGQAPPTKLAAFKSRIAGLAAELADPKTSAERKAALSAVIPKLKRYLASAAKTETGRRAASSPALRASVDPDECTLLEAIEPEGRVIDVLAIRTGMSRNRKRYSPAVLREAVTRGVFDGAKAFASDGPDHDRAKRGVKSLVGWWDNARFGTFPLPRGGLAEGVAAHFHPVDPALRAFLREAIASGRPDLIGFSIFGDGPVTRQADGSFVVDRIDLIESIDPVIHPAAGGTALRLVASEGPMNCTKCGALIEGDHVCATAPASPDVSALVEAAVAPLRTGQYVEAAIASRPGLPDATKARIRALTEGRALSVEDVGALVETEAAYVATLTPARVTDSGSGITPGDGEHDKMVEAVDDVLTGKAHSIRRLYEDLTGDRSMTGRLQEGGRLTEAVTSSSFPLVMQQALHKRLLAEYAKPGLDDWRKIVSNVGGAIDFRTQKLVAIGGYGDLPGVSEGAAYTALTTPSDVADVTFPAVTKKGGLETLTLEGIANDDVRALRRIPTSLARAAKRTLFKGVFDVLASNPTFPDGGGLALFHATHANLGSTAISEATIAAGRLAMAKQTEPGSSERLGIPAKFLVIPIDLRQTVFVLLKTEQVTGSNNNDVSFARSVISYDDVIEVPYWTDTNNWFLVADPTMYDTIEVSFFNGQQEPELLLQDMPSVGDNFAKDILTYKIRHIWAVSAVEYRTVYGAVVA